MINQSSSFKTTQRSKAIFVASIGVALFWFLGSVINVYHFTWVGAIFEILWLPALAMLFVLPVLSVIFLRQEKLNIRSLYLYSILIILATILGVSFYK